LEAGWRARASQDIKNFQAFAIFNQTQISIKLNLLNLNKNRLV
jgi:siderophore synthetase component